MQFEAVDDETGKVLAVSRYLDPEDPNDAHWFDGQNLSRDKNRWACLPFISTDKPYTVRLVAESVNVR